MDKLKQDRSIRYSGYLKEIKENLHNAAIAIDTAWLELESLLNNRSAVSKMIEESDRPLDVEFDAIQQKNNSKDLWIKANSVLSVLGRMKEEIREEVKSL